MIATVRHAGRRSCVGDEHSLLRAFGSGKEFDDWRIEMHAIRDDVGAQAAVREYGAQDAGTAMIQRTHGIKSMSCMPRAGRDPTLGGLKISVGMSQAHANAAPRRLDDD